MNSSIKYHVVKITSSGLGDAIKAMLAAALYCELSGRHLIVDWRKSRYSNGDENTFYSLFDLQNIQSDRHIPPNLDTYPENWRQRLNKSMHEVYLEDNWSCWNRDEIIAAYSIDFAQMDYAESITLSWDFDQLAKLLPHFPNCSTTSELFHYAANKFLVINSSIEREVNELLQQLPEQYLAAHIRATREFDENKGSTPLNRYLDLIARHVTASSETFFIASDNAEVQRMLIAQYPNLVTINKWFADSGEALHLSENCPDKLENAISALKDILLLAGSETLICNPQSCFSECAQYFSANNKQRVLSVLPSATMGERLRALVRKFTPAFPAK